MVSLCQIDFKIEVPKWILSQFLPGAAKKWIADLKKYYLANYGRRERAATAATASSTPRLDEDQDKPSPERLRLSQKDFRALISSGDRNDN